MLTTLRVRAPDQRSPVGLGTSGKNIVRHPVT